MSQNKTNIGSMKRVWLFLIKGIFVVLCILLVEAACFRLLDNYANWRLNLSWGEPSNPSYNPILKNIPLDHYAYQPTGLSSYNHLGYWIRDENQYCLQVTSFTRPKRDNYEDFLLEEFEPLANYEIRDYDRLHGVVLPGLKKMATIDDVKAQNARRVGDALEYANGVFIKVVLYDGSFSLVEEVKNIEDSFGFLLKEGFACLVLPVFSIEDLNDKILAFKESEELLSQHLFGWAEGNAASILMGSAQQYPEMWKVVMLSEPEIFVPPPESSVLPWVYFEIDEERSFRDEGLSFLYDWIKLVRQNENIYASRLAGLIRYSQKFHLNVKIPSHFIAYAIFCSKFISEMNGKLPKLQKESLLSSQDTIEMNSTISDTAIIAADEKISFEEDQVLLDLEILKANVDSSLINDRFNCEIIRTYREINADDKKLSLVSNRDLILKLGLGFEEMGKEVFEQIRHKDPLFYRYYISFRAIEESPLN